MKRYLTLILILIMAVSLCACGQNESPDAAGSAASAAEDSAGGTDADTVAQDKQEGAVEIEITPPEGWTPVEGSVIPVQYMKGTASFMVKEEPFSGTTLDDVVDEALIIYQDSFDNVKIQGEAEPFTVDEKDARKLTFTCTVGNFNMKFLYVYLFAADKTYVITFGDQESTFDTMTADYETILSDIRFITQ
jgi:predicted small lipoprotein YifL